MCENIKLYTIRQLLVFFETSSFQKFFFTAIWTSLEKSSKAFHGTHSGSGQRYNWLVALWGGVNSLLPGWQWSEVIAIGSVLNISRGYSVLGTTYFKNNFKSKYNSFFRIIVSYKTIISYNLSWIFSCNVFFKSRNLRIF